jgi:glycosyltransferase involved in cell wall biosynthesis
MESSIRDSCLGDARMKPETPLRVLMFGHCHLVHIAPLARALKKLMAPVTIEAYETATEGENVGGNPELMERELGLTAYYKNDSTRTIAARLTRRLLRSASVLTPLLRKFDDPVNAAIRSRQYDLYHLHWPSQHSQNAFDAIPKSSPLVVSFWGHDVLDGSSALDHQFQRRAIARANIITVRSIELREHLFSKFGRSFAKKIRIAKFANDMFTEYGLLRPPELREAFREKHAIQQDQITVCVGHCGYPKENHLEAIDAISAVAAKERLPVTLLVPLTYGGTSLYRSEIKQLLDRCGLPSICFETFMERNRIWELRCATDVFISVPEEDSFSGSMCESILAGAVAIVGDWLPYGGLRRRGIHFRSIEHIDDLATVLSQVLQDLALERELVRKTSKELRFEVDIETVIPGWVAAYNDALCARIED